MWSVSCPLVVSLTGANGNCPEVELCYSHNLRLQQSPKKLSKHKMWIKVLKFHFLLQRKTKHVSICKVTISILPNRMHALPF